MGSISVLLVDDHSTFLDIVTRFLQSHPDIVIVGTAGDGKAALRSARVLQPQVILLDLAMPDLSGLEVISPLRLIVPTAAIIVLTLLDGDGYRQAALAAGATDFVSKTTLSTDLLPAIRRIMRTIGSQQRGDEKL
jgi:DNA-binding NarL/FixJ family response regulator